MPEKSKESVTDIASAIFHKVRDIPYVLGLDGDPNKLFKEYLGNCTRKHLFLAPRLHNLGYKVSLGIAWFDWRDLPIPQELLNLLQDSIDTHLFLYATLGIQEQVVDATWDQAMPQGFNINNWNGFDSTEIGVKPIDVIRVSCPLFTARMRVGNIIKSLGLIKNQNHPTPFNDAFNHWLNRGSLH